MIEEYLDSVLYFISYCHNQNLHHYIFTLQNFIHVGSQTNIDPGWPGCVFREIFKNMRNSSNRNGRDRFGKKTLETNEMRKELDNLTEKRRKRVKKHINNDDMTWTKEALLRLIHIKKRNMARQKVVKGTSDRGRQIPTHG